MGLSYREIRRSVPVAKATLSLWLRSVGLARPQVQRLTEKRLAAGRRGAEKVHRERLERVAQTVSHATLEASERVHQRDVLWLVGTVLYWAEGTKPKEWRPNVLVEFSNTDVRMLLVARARLQLCCGVTDADITYMLQIHKSADLQSARDFWERRLHIASGRLRIYLKKHNPSPGRKNTERAYCGTIKMRVRRSTLLNHRIVGWIQGLATHWGVG